MNGWKLVYDAWDPQAEPLREALCTVGNGYFATRGAAAESRADATHYPGTYIAGCYNRLQTEISGRTIENESLVNAPNWLTLGFRIEGGDWFDIDAVEVLSYHQELDLAQGILLRSLRFRDPSGRHTRIEQHRLASMAAPHLGAQLVLIRAEDWSGAIEVCSALNGCVVNAGVARYRDLNHHHLAPLTADTGADGSQLLEMETNQSHIRIALAATTRLWRNGSLVEVEPDCRREDGYVAHHYRLEIEPAQPLRIEKISALYTSRDRAISAPGLEARKAVADAAPFSRLAERHALVWQQLWQHFDFDLEHETAGTGERTERILRLHLFHLLQTTSPHVMDLDVGVPARGLHGEAYRGHIFWDELFVFPLFNLRMPEITRALLRYRYRRLGEARRAARAAGCRGAMFPWQSGSNGREESQRLHLNPESGNWIPDNSHLQRHINAAVAYNTWQYYQATRDVEFLSFYGAEMILEIARFWAGVATYNNQRKRYEILGVMGPDEHHDSYPGAEQPGLDNNAYTNLMAVWVLSRALELWDILPGQRLTELCQSLDLSREELTHWDEVSRSMYIPFHGKGIISQFDGYETLEEFDWEGYRKRYGDIQRLDRILEAEEDTPNRYQVSKQADVLMLFYLFSSEELSELFERLDYPFEYETIPRNIDYYMQRTSHGSTLSRVVHSWVLARSNRPGCWPLFMEALESDVADIQGGTTQEGIHTGAMAGTVDLVQRCFTGIETRGNVLWLNPSLPEGLKSLNLKIRYRGHQLALHMTPTHLRISTEPSAEQPISIGIRTAVHQLNPGEMRQFELQRDG
ncbi:glycoside hydrolase family 65 protein [Thiohalobacter thiocyanaticus]|uniref:Glycoside hydrolase family 65 protein n=1 Tax=Thiohalobacter thiocyanaticus TaxID=585455 RepID=A0A426QGX5_9GAMM|nr:glycosyl hydrolase family 65 protein [Thiohalobacter thiocyanaticus]RRQ21015.1 glycoside hydrolase family 65 protein [Thiohalobacter thiocyanaticus]